MSANSSAQPLPLRRVASVWAMTVYGVLRPFMELSLVLLKGIT
nr:MAG TPA: hypothetical protein [Caudoviricetes sp.]